MEIFIKIIELFAGIGVFLVGVHLLSSNIEQLANSSIKQLFKKTANNKLVNIGIGATTTAIIQSSGVTTVLIVGFVNVGAMSLYQATSMIMGANIGTTITAHIASLQQFDFTKYVQALSLIGIMMTMVWKKESVKKVGFILAGLSLIFIGLELMKNAMSNEVIKPILMNLFLVVDDPFLLLFIGILVTALAQSSSATTSVIITLAAVPGFVFGRGGNSVLYMILGTNIGSCVTALMSSIGAGANAKRASLIHLLFNTVGSLIFFVVLIIWKDFMNMTFGLWFKGSYATQIAMFHTFFNLACTIIFMPFTSLFVKVATLLIKDKDERKITCNLDDRLLSTTSLALEQIKKELVRLSDVSMDAFNSAYKCFTERKVSGLDNPKNLIADSNELSKAIADYLIKTSANTNTKKEEEIISDMHNNIGDVMRISEIADNFIKYTKKEVSDDIIISSEVLEKINVMAIKINELHKLTKLVILENEVSLLEKVDNVEEEIDNMRKSLIEEHIERLNLGKTKPESSSIFINLVSNLERLGDHLTYIAHTVKE